MGDAEQEKLDDIQEELQSQRIEHEIEEATDELCEEIEEVQEEIDAQLEEICEEVEETKETAEAAAVMAAASALSGPPEIDYEHLAKCVVDEQERRMPVIVKEPEPHVEKPEPIKDDEPPQSKSRLFRKIT